MNVIGEPEVAHRIKLVARGAGAMTSCDAREFERLTGVSYLPELAFADEKTIARISKQCEAAVSSGAVTSEMKWLGTYYAETIHSHSVADVSIRWIDATLGYGLFAEHDLDAGEYIGEYTGIVRRRNIFFRNHNEYCFSYPTSDLSLRKHMIDAKHHGNELRFANHSKQPNCEARCVLVDGILHMIVRSIKPIDASSQITYDYSDDYWSSRRPVPN